MRSLLSLLVLIFHSCLVHALHKSDVGVVDWYKKLVGAPLVANIATAPTFHRVGGKDVVLTATTSNVLAALDPEDGHVAWRHIFEPEDRIAGFYKHDNVVATLSGPGGAILRTFDTQTGVLLLEKSLHPPELGLLAEPHFFGKHVVFGGDNDTDLYVLTNGHTFARLNGMTGDIIWTFAVPDASSLVIHTKLVLTPSALYLVGVAKSISSYTLHVTSLVPESGELIASANIPSSIAEAITDFLILTQDKSNNARVIWLEQGSIKHVALMPKIDAKPVTVKNAEFEQLIDVGLSGQGQLIAIKRGGTARIIKLVENGIKGVHEFKDSAPSDVQPQSIYAGGLDDKGHAHFARVYWANSHRKIAVEVYSGIPETNTSYLDFDTTNHGTIAFATLDIKAISQADISPRLLISTFTGSVQLFDQTQLKWNRDEALTTAVLSEFVELPPPRAVVSDHDGESFGARVVRHIGDLQDLPAYILNFARRFSGQSSVTAAVKLPLNTREPTRDEFGFRQIIVVATMFGKVYGIDSATGETVWTRLLGLGWAAEVGGRIIPVKLFVFGGEGFGDKGKGTRTDVVLVAQRRADNTLVDTVVFHIDAATGEDATGKIAPNDVLEGIDLVQGPIVESYLLQHDGQKVALFFDEFLQTYTYPETEEAYAFVKKLAPSLYFPLRTSVDSAASPQSAASAPPKLHRLIGHQISMNDALSRDRLVAYPVWSLSFPDNEDIVGLVSPARDPIASFGKVLANRTTLYKYLNPHMSVVLTAQRGSGTGSASVAGATSTRDYVRPSCGVYLVDSVKGAIIYRASLPALGPRGNCDVKVTLTDNWLVYHYYDPEEGAVDEARGWRMVSVELYEGELDEKTKSSEVSSYSNSSTQLQVYEDAFVFPHEITAISTTKTKYGISMKDIIVATKSNKIQSFPRRVLDPRRPRQKPTNQELEEGLIQYDPVLPDNPKGVLSHEYEVANIQHIVTAPSLLESTSLVFVSGLDMFLTRTSPSGTFDLLSENFNKKQLVWTVGGLLAAILVARPIVRERVLNGKWYP